MKNVQVSKHNYRKKKKHYKEHSYNLKSNKIIANLIRENRLGVHFQPIVSTASQRIFAYEGLCRVDGPNPFASIETLFEQARICGQTFDLDMQCRKNTLQLASEQNIDKTGALLFLNVCPASLQQNGHSPGETERYVNECGLNKENVILEITEQDAISDYPLFLEAIKYYRNCGFKIAIDDFGAGYGGLKMLSLVAPDFVKIDRHFIADVDSAHINYSLIDSIATICHRIGIDVIAEGVETESEMKVCNDFGIELLQGYYFARPTSELVHRDQIKIPQSNHSSISSSYNEAICIEDIISHSGIVDVNDRVLAVLERFTADPQLYCLPVLAGEVVRGVINRHRFMEQSMVGRHGFGMNLNYYKKVEDILETGFLQVANYMPIEEVAKMINLRENISMYDDICVTQCGKFMGMVAVRSILNVVTDRSIKNAKGANPLTGLPGNEFIQREIVKMLSQSIHFDVCYIDIDSFKPYNDKHGYTLGDEVIKEVGNIIVAAANKFRLNGIGFAGHIGGDDFIVITRPKQSIAASQFIIDKFAEKLSVFHTQASVDCGYYVSIDREGNKKEFPLLSMSIGIVSTEVHRITSAGEVSSIASDLKKQAKAVQGSSIIRDRRVQSWFEISREEPIRTGAKVIVL